MKIKASRFYLNILLTAFGLSSVLLPFWVETAAAAGLAIIDCQGVTRAVRDVDTLSKNNIQLNVLDAQGNIPGNANVTLTNTVTGETVTVTAENGVASFEGIQSGSWVVSSSVEGLNVATIAIGTELSVVAAAGVVTAAGVATGAAATGVVVAGGAIVDEVDDSSSDSTPTPTPTPTPEIPVEQPTPLPTPAPTPNQDSPSSPAPPTPTPTPECPCTPDDVPPDTYQDPNDFFNTSAASSLSAYQ